eukprot:GFYU01002913.1.p1 GENE.GFYU01002913.1~~GFYU01002913.1.p1  ORF type:complete len:555 (+),score=143.76 GFYU01002913.1:187-1851(+)
MQYVPPDAYVGEDVPMGQGDIVMDAADDSVAAAEAAGSIDPQPPTFTYAPNVQYVTNNNIDELEVNAAQAAQAAEAVNVANAVNNALNGMDGKGNPDTFSAYENALRMSGGPPGVGGGGVGGGLDNSSVSHSGTVGEDTEDIDYMEDIDLEELGKIFDTLPEWKVSTPSQPPQPPAGTPTPVRADFLGTPRKTYTESTPSTSESELLDRKYVPTKDGDASQSCQLECFSANDLLRQGVKPVIIFDHNTTALNALRALCENAILSAPLYDPANMAYTGVIELLDLLAEVLKVLKNVRKNVLKELDKDIAGVTDPKLAAAEEEIHTIPVKQLMNQESPSWRAISPDMNLFAVCQILCEVRRVVVMLPTGELCGVLSQSRMIEYFVQNNSVLEESLLERRIKDFNRWGTHVAIFTVDEEDAAIAAFRRMHGKKVSSIGITRGSGQDKQLVDAIYVSDLKPWYEWDIDGVRMIFDGLTSLGNSCKDYLKDRRNPSLPTRLTTITEGETLRALISKLHANKSHHAFVLRDQNALMPRFVISLSDVLKEVCSAYGYHVKT